MSEPKNEYTEVILAGELGKKFGRVWNLVVNNPVHALRLIGLNRPDFKKYMVQKAREGVHYHVIVDKRHRSAKELELPAGKRLIVAPAVTGAGGKIGGIFEIIAGAVIIFFTWYTGVGGQIGASLMAVGASLILGGVTNLLTTVPKVSSGQAATTLQSAYFNGASNTQQQGVPVPVVYGEMLIGSQVVSASLSAVDASSAGVLSGLVQE